MSLNSRNFKLLIRYSNEETNKNDIRILRFVNDNLNKFKQMGIVINPIKIKHSDLDSDFLDNLKKKGISSLPALIVPGDIPPYIGVIKIKKVLNDNIKRLEMYNTMHNVDNDNISMGASADDKSIRNYLLDEALNSESQQSDDFSGGRDFDKRIAKFQERTNSKKSDHHERYQDDYQRGGRRKINMSHRGAPNDDRRNKRENRDDYRYDDSSDDEYGDNEIQPRSRRRGSGGRRSVKESVRNALREQPLTKEDQLMEDKMFSDLDNYELDASY